MRISTLQRSLTFALALLLFGGGAAGLWVRSLATVDDLSVLSRVAPSPAVPPAKDGWPGGEIWAGPEEAKGSERIRRYELSGTFQVFDGELEGVESAALVDDRETGEQRIVREGDLLGFFQVGPILEDRLTLVRGERSWVLSLSGVEPLVRSPSAAQEEEQEVLDPRDLPALETTRFGKLVKENYWILERDAVKAYIDEMMQPQNMIRTAQLYRSFSQRSEQGDEEPGFEIAMKAEQDFFADMGLQDGDIIRRVNSMKMRTQRRAEYLLREFYRDNMSAVVLDVERNGEVQQHIYLVR